MSRYTVACQIQRSYTNCEGALAEVLNLTGMGARLQGKRVLLKVNMMKGTSPSECNTTHPDFVAALVRLLIKRDCEVLVGDSSGIVGFTDEVMQASGMANAVRGAGGCTVNFDEGPFRKIEVDSERPFSVFVPRLLFEVDSIIQLPKLKTHTFTTLTGAVKGLIGLLPGATKCELHNRATGVDEFCQSIMELYVALLRIGLPLHGAIVDGIWGLSGRGPGVGPKPQSSGLVLAGEDLTAVDFASALMVGFDPHEVPLCSLAAKRGEGPSSQEDIEILGESLENARVRFVKPKRDWEERTRLITWLHYWTRGHVVNVKHDPSLCNRCRKCIDVCPVDCIRLKPSGLIIGDACIRCYACHHVCPTAAMPLSCKRGLRWLFEKRTEGLDTHKMV